MTMGISLPLSTLSWSPAIVPSRIRNHVNQCFYLRVAAGLLGRTGASVPSLSEVWAKASLQRSTFALAAACLESLGLEPDLYTQAEEDLRTFLHDALFFGHGKDYRCLAALPLDEAEEPPFASFAWTPGTVSLAKSFRVCAPVLSPSPLFGL